jgi:hypothetical protein
VPELERAVAVVDVDELYVRGVLVVDLDDP